MAIVSLRDQHISIYDARGKFLEAPVSTGSAGCKTPAGIFAIVQKKEMHSSKQQWSSARQGEDRRLLRGSALLRHPSFR